MDIIYHQGQALPLPPEGGASLPLPLPDPALTPKDENLNNPSIEPHGEDCGCPGAGLPDDIPDDDGKEMIVVVTLPEDGGNFDLGQLMSMLSELANASDDAGMMDQADKLDGVMASLEKVAQYENCQNYWIANGRAFELAWKEKRQKGKSDDSSPDDFNSAQECWMEVLEEYQNSLLTNQNDFIAKYVKASKKEKEVEKAECGQSSTMSENMTAFHKKIKEKGGTEGESIVEWLDEVSKKKADKSLEDRLSVKLSSGIEPGVAVYESVYELNQQANREKLKVIAQATSAALEAIETLGGEHLSKKAFWGGLWDRLTSPFKGWMGNQFYRFKDWLGDTMATTGESFKLMRAVRRKLPILMSEMEEIEDAVQTASVSPAQLATALNVVLPDVEKFYQLVSPTVALPPIPNPNDQRYLSRVTNGVDKQGFHTFIQDLRRLLMSINDKTALVYENSLKNGQVPAQNKPNMTTGPQPENAKVIKSLEEIITNLNDAAGQDIVPIPMFNRMTEALVPKLLDEAVQKIREEGDYEGFSEEIKDRIMDRIYTPMKNYINNAFQQKNPRERQYFLTYKREIARDISKAVERALRSKYQRIFQYRQQQNPGQQFPGQPQIPQQGQPQKAGQP